MSLTAHEPSSTLPFGEKGRLKSLFTAGGALIPDKKAVTEYPIHELLAKRWSPYAFADRPVSKTDLLSLFEAARWAPSSYNEQPWSYIVATKEDSTQFPQILSCLVEGNQAWAKAAPVLALGIVSLKFTRNAKGNRAAVQDLGLASGNLLMEATARGLSVYQMIRILPDKAREIYQIPDAWEAWTGLAIGYQGDPMSLPDNLKERDLTPRQHKPLSQFVFAGKWGNPSELVQKKSLWALPACESGCTNAKWIKAS